MDNTMQIVFFLHDIGEADILSIASKLKKQLEYKIDPILPPLPKDIPMDSRQNMHRLIFDNGKKMVVMTSLLCEIRINNFSSYHDLEFTVNNVFDILTEENIIIGQIGRIDTKITTDFDKDIIFENLINADYINNTREIELAWLNTIENNDPLLKLNIWKRLNKKENGEIVLINDINSRNFTHKIDKEYLDYFMKESKIKSDEFIRLIEKIQEKDNDANN